MIETNPTFIIEDNAGDLVLLKTQLRTAGWPIEGANENASLSGAIEKLKIVKPVVVFLDLNLPDSNGLETFLTIQETVPDVPIIILSGLSDTALSLQAVQAGAQDFLVKGEFEEKLLPKTILYSIERKKTQLKMHEINERFLYAAKATNEPLWDWDLKSDEILWNEKVKIFGYHDSINKNECWRIDNIHPDDKERINMKLSSLSNNTEEQWSEKYRFRCADGSYKYIYDRGYVLRDKNHYPYRIIGTMQDMTEQVVMQQQLADEQERSQKAILKATIESQEKERNVIGRELHDNVNQILAAANMYLGLVTKKHSKSVQLVEDSRNLIVKAVNEIRKLTHNIVSSHIDYLGVVAAIETNVEEMNAYLNFKIKFEHNLQEDIIPYPVGLAIFRIIQEQLNNIIKYAEATEVLISLDMKGDNLILQITDDGKGAVLENLKMKHGIGLSNIKNRIAAYDGQVAFETSPGHGFKVNVTLPFKPGEEKINMAAHPRRGD